MIPGCALKPNWLKISLSTTAAISPSLGAPLYLISALQLIHRKLPRILFSFISRELSLALSIIFHLLSTLFPCYACIPMDCGMKKGIKFQPYTVEKSTLNSESSHTQTHKRRKRVKRNLALLFIFARKAHDPWHIDKWVIRCRHHRKLVFICDSHGIYSFAFFFLENSRNEAFLMGKICEQIKRTIRDKWISRCKDIFKNFFSIFFHLAFGIA